MDCPDNCGCKITMNRNTQDIQRIWKAINWMTKSVIVSSGMIILFVLTSAVNYFLKFLP